MADTYTRRAGPTQRPRHRTPGDGRLKSAGLDSIIIQAAKSKNWKIPLSALCCGLAGPSSSSALFLYLFFGRRTRPERPLRRLPSHRSVPRQPRIRFRGDLTLTRLITSGTVQSADLTRIPLPQGEDRWKRRLRTARAIYQKLLHRLSWTLIKTATVSTLPR